jgi:hypothetical protein
MGVAWYIVLEKDLAGASLASIDGKAVARAHEELDQIASQLGLVAPSTFLSQSTAQATAIAEELDLEIDEVPQEQWFPAETGLTTIQGVLTRLRESGGAPRLLADLEAMEGVLRAAKDARVRFHFSIDL